MDHNQLLAYKQRASAWAKGVLGDEDAIILDTETTGLTGTAQIVELGIISSAGEVLMDTRLRPTVGIDPMAVAVHGITDEQLIDSPTMADVFNELMSILTAASRVIIYNVGYDKRLLRQTLQAFGKYDDARPFLERATFECAMLRYAEWCGEYSEGKDSFKWQKLVGGDHSAVGDCLATLDCLKMMAETVEGDWRKRENFLNNSIAARQLEFGEIEDGA